MSKQPEQIGGDHYAVDGDYQHWDFADDFQLSYLVGTATKYVWRHRRKNGAEDLKKALSYIEKIQNSRYGHVYANAMRNIALMETALVGNGMHVKDFYTIEAICRGSLASAKRSIRNMLRELYDDHNL